MTTELEQQFKDSYDELSDAVFRRCLFKTSDREVALDLTQDTFMRVWDYIQEGKNIRNLKAFTYTVANNLIKDYYKKKKATPMRDMGQYDPLALIEDTNENIEAKAEVEQVVKAMEQLEEKDREVLMMRYVDGKHPQDIAEILSERTNTISVRIHRARKKLLTFFE